MPYTQNKPTEGRREARGLAHSREPTAGSLWSPYEHRKELPACSDVPPPSPGPPKMPRERTAAHSLPRAEKLKVTSQYLAHDAKRAGISSCLSWPPCVPCCPSSPGGGAVRKRPPQQLCPPGARLPLSACTQMKGRGPCLGPVATWGLKCLAELHFKSGPTVSTKEPALPAPRAQGKPATLKGPLQNLWAPTLQAPLGKAAVAHRLCRPPHLIGPCPGNRKPPPSTEKTPHGAASAQRGALAPA